MKGFVLFVSKDCFVSVCLTTSKDGAMPSAKVLTFSLRFCVDVSSSQLREIEVEGNAVFDVYRELYYEGGVSSMCERRESRVNFLLFF